MKLWIIGITAIIIICGTILTLWIYEPGVSMDCPVCPTIVIPTPFPIPTPPPIPTDNQIEIDKKNNEIEDLESEIKYLESILQQLEELND
jgi:hypothetical protein